MVGNSVKAADGYRSMVGGCHPWSSGLSLL